MGIVTGRVTSSRWVRRILAVVIAFELVVAGGVTALQASDRTSAYDTVEALEQFRAGAGASEPGTATTTPTAPTTSVAPLQIDGAGSVPAPTTVPAAGGAPTTSTPASAAVVPSTVPIPDEGVYVYRTDGFESVDALGGSRHDYPAETTTTIVRTDCGYSERWQPLDERHDVRTICAAADRHLAVRFLQAHAFFGRSDTRDLECEPGSTIFLPTAQPGDRFSWRCADARTDSVTQIEIIGREPVVIGGTTIEAVHLRASTDATGEAAARSVFDAWVHPVHGLTLRRVSNVDGTTPGPGGDVNYHEEYTIELVSLEPMR